METSFAKKVWENPVFLVIIKGIKLETKIVQITY